jgi:hypothetical protein
MPSPEHESNEPGTRHLRAVADEPEYDYGEGKTREQEAHDSMAMLGVALAASVLTVLALVVLVWWLL